MASRANIFDQYDDASPQPASHTYAGDNEQDTVRRNSRPPDDADDQHMVDHRPVLDELHRTLLARGISADYFVDKDGRLTINIDRRPTKPQVGAGEHGLPYMPPLPAEHPPQAETRPEQPTLEDRVQGRLAPRVPLSGAEGPGGAPVYVEGTEGRRNYLELPGMRLPVGDFVDRPGRELFGMARTAPMLMGMTGGPQGAVTGGIKHIAEQVPKVPAAIAAVTAGLFGAPSTAGDDLRSQRAAEQSQRDVATLDAAQRQLEALVQQRASLDRQRSMAVADRDSELRGGVDKSGKPIKAGRGPNYDAKQAEIARLTTEMEKLDGSIDDLRKRSSPQFVADMAKVREAEAVRQDILDRSSKPFEKEYPEASKNWWLAPMILGGLTALALRGRIDIPERLQASRWWKAVERAGDSTLTPAQRAEARILADKFEKSMPKKEWDDVAKSYKWPLTLGAAEGAGVANIPEFHNLFLPPENPERRAYEEYIKRLPLGHPEIARTIEMIKSMPEDNPDRRAAIQHFARIYPAIVKGGEGALEATFGATAGTTASKVIAPAESGLPRPETGALIDAATRRARIPPPAAASAPTAPEIAPKPESWQIPAGGTIKRGEDGKTWHDEKGHFTAPPPKGSKRVSIYDRITMWGGFG